jgi:hypothetical protein
MTGQHSLSGMQIALASQPAVPGAVNLDWAGAAACGTAVVLDGLSELAETGCRHGTAWYVSALGTRLLDAAADPDTTLADALAYALTAVAEAHRDTCDLNHPGTPGATVAVVRPRMARPDTVDYLVLSDAVVVLDTGDAAAERPSGPRRGQLVVVSDLRVEEHLADLRATAAGSSAGDPEARHRLIRAQQALRNRPEGYWVAGATAESARHALTGEAAGVRSALLLSDGAALLATAFQAATWQQLVDLARERGPAEVIAATRELEARDPDRTVWPRYKTHDDATAVLCDLRRLSSA